MKSEVSIFLQELTKTATKTVQQQKETGHKEGKKLKTEIYNKGDAMVT